MSDKYSSAAFRRSIVHYTGGRLLNAVAGFFVFVWIARQLPEQQYANYVAAFAILEIGLVLSSFGMEWVTAVYIPQVRLNATGKVLGRFVWQCAAVQTGLYFFGACVFFALAPEFSRLLGLEGASGTFRVYALVMFTEGMSRVFRDQLLSCLLLQGAAQATQLARHVVMVALALWMFQHEQWRTAEALGFAELAASSCSLMLAAGFLYRHLLLERGDPAANPGWQLPRWADLMRAGRNAWLSNLANLSWGGQMVIVLVTRLIGAEATAPLGFARNLAEQIRRYMPMEFMFGVMRTLLIARFAADGDFRKLGVRAGLMYKANLLFLLPLLVLAIVRGDEVCALLSAGRYGNAHWLLVGWLIVLIALAHHRLTDLLAHAVGRSGVTSRTSTILLVTPAALVAVMQLQQLALLFLVLLAAEAAYSGMVLARIRTPDWKYQPHWSGLARFALAAVIASGALHMAHFGSGVLSLLLATGLACVVVWAGILLFRGLSCEETALLPEKLNRWVLFRRAEQ